MRTILFVTSVLLSLGVAAQAAETKTYEQICESARLRSVERADCRAQMKAAPSDESRRSIFQTFDVKANGTLAQIAVPAESGASAQ